MLDKLNQSSGRILAYRAIGTIKKEDYASLISDVETVIASEGTVHLLLDLTEFKWEEMKAWGADLKFGHDYHEQIAKLAIVGDKKWQEWLSALADPFYAQEAMFFHLEDQERAWDWLRE